MKKLMILAVLFAACEKDPIEIPMEMTIPPTMTVEPPKEEPKDDNNNNSNTTNSGVSSPTMVAMPPAHMTAQMSMTMEITDTVTETFSTEVPDDAITDDPRLTFVSTDGKGGNEYVINNRESDNAPAFIVSVDGDYRPVYGSDGNTVQIQAGSNWFITYAREYQVGDSRVLVEESINQTVQGEFIDAIMAAQDLVPARNNYSRTIGLVNNSIHNYNAGGTAGYDYYDVAASNAGSLWVHIHEMGHNFDASAGIVDHGVLQMLYDMPDMFFISDYGNNNGTGEYWADAFAFYYIQMDHINHILEYIMSWLD